MIVALWYGLTWYQGDISQWLSIAEVVGLCVVGVVAYVIGLLITGFRPRHLKLILKKTSCTGGFTY